MSEFITKDSGERVEFESGMRRDVDAGKPRFDLIVPEGVPYQQQFLTRVASLMARGAEKYGDRNWELANSEAEMRRFKSSGFRHFMQWFMGEVDEDHAAAVVFNLMCYETLKTRQKIATEDTDPHMWPAELEEPLREALLETFDECVCGSLVCGDPDFGAVAQVRCCTYTHGYDACHSGIGDVA